MADILTFTIDGTDVTEHAQLGTLKITYRRNDFNRCSIDFKDVDFVPAPGDPVLLVITDTRTDTKLFSGWLIDSDSEALSSNLHIARCSFTQDMFGLGYGKVTEDYSAGSLNEKEILADIFSEWAPSPIGTNVIDGVDTPIKFTDASIKRIIDELAAQNTRYWYFDPTRDMHYFASTGEAAPFALSDAPNNTTTFAYDKPHRRTSRDGLYNVIGGSVVCRKDGLRPGMAIQITNIHFGWAAQTFIINEVTMSVIKKDEADPVFEYDISFGDVQKPRITDYIIRGNQNVSAVDQGLVPTLENDGTKFFRSDGVYAAIPVSGTVATDPIWDAKGDLAAGTGANTAVRLPVGADGYFLKANSSKSMGLEWVAAGVGHTQNEDWILLDSIGGSQLFAGGSLKKTLHVDANQIISGDGYLTVESTSASGQLLLRTTGANSTIYLTNYGVSGAKVYIRSQGNIIFQSAEGSLVLNVATVDNAAVEGGIYYNHTNHIIRVCNGATWSDVGSSHAQNTDWKLLASSGGVTIIDSGQLVNDLYVGSGIGIYGSSASLIIGNTANGGILYLKTTNHNSSIKLTNSGLTATKIELDTTGNIILTSSSGSLVLPLKTSDPTGTEGAIYYHSTNHVLRHHNGSAWADVGIAFDAAQNDVTGSRTLDVDYQNTSGKVMVVLVNMYHYGVADSYAYVSPNNPPTDYMPNRETFGLASATQSHTVICVVPKNYYYRIGPNTNTVVKWTEWGLG